MHSRAPYCKEDPGSRKCAYFPSYMPGFSLNLAWLYLFPALLCPCPDLSYSPHPTSFFPLHIPLPYDASQNGTTSILTHRHDDSLSAHSRTIPCFQRRVTRLSHALDSIVFRLFSKFHSSLSIASRAMYPTIFVLM